MLCSRFLASTLGIVSLGATAIAGEPEEFAEFAIFIEINATDGDAGLQGKIDGDAWHRARIYGPNEAVVFEYRAKDNLGDHGVTEVQWESNEPPFDEFPLADFLALFPEGEYRARGKTVEDGRLVSTADLTHDLPAGPVITSHEDEDEVELDGSNLKIEWLAVTEDYRGGALASDIDGYVVVAEVDLEIMGVEVTQVVTIDVDADTHFAEIPGDFLFPGREYKIEIGARESSGNLTFTEMALCTVDEVPDA